ncbi:MAG: hypothetical protein HQK59_00020 [Deltaproteobacteria bacterium]|nr:hypothetical protein [Deltaproteobacteria bacterium]
MNVSAFFASLIIFGGLALVGQVLLLRELLVTFYGNELVIGIILASWLLGVSAGAKLGPVLIGPRLTMGRMFTAATALAGPMIWGMIAACSLFRGMWHLTSGEVIPFPVLCWGSLVLTMPVGAVVGAVFVLATGLLAARSVSEPQAQLAGGRVFLLESLGSGLGLGLFTFALAGRVDPLTITGGFYALLMLAVIMTMVPGKKAVALGLGLISLSYGCGAYGLGRQAYDYLVHKRWSQTFPGFDLVRTQDTPYQHAAVATQGGLFSLFGNNTLLYSFPNPYLFDPIVSLIMAQAPQARRILLVGQGPGGMFSPLLSYPIERLVYLELDSDLSRMTIRVLPPSDRDILEQDKRLTIIYDDVRRFAQRSQERFDLIILNLPNPATAMVNRLFTREFYQSVRLLLRDRGVVVTGLTASEAYIGPTMSALIGSVYHTLQSVFPNVVVTAGQDIKFFAAAGPATITTDVDLLAQRYQAQGRSSAHFSPQSFRMFFPPTEHAYLMAQLQQAARLPVNTDERPLSYLYSLMLWQQMEGRAWMKIGLEKLIQGWWPAILGAVVLGYLVLCRSGSTTVLGGVVIGGTGFLAMTVQILLLYIFQNAYGVLFQDVGLITALFMFGLAAGGYTVSKWRIWSSSPVKRLVVVELCFALVILATGWLGRGELSQALLWGLIPLVGMLAGYQFPVLFALILTGGQGNTAAQDQAMVNPAGRAAAVLETADHLGGALGAVLAGILVVPVLGIWQASLLLGGVKLLNLIPLYRLGRRRRVLLIGK